MTWPKMEKVVKNSKMDDQNECAGFPDALFSPIWCAENTRR